MVARLADVEWSQLVELLTTHRQSAGCASTPCSDRKCPAKMAFPAWSPVAVAQCPPVCRVFAPAHTKPDGTFVPEKGCGGGRPHRLNENVEAITAAVFDLDHVTEEQLGALDFGGLTFVLYSTHSSRADDICLRLVLRLSRPVAPAEWRAVRAAAIARYGIPADPSVKDLARLYFLPDAPAGTTPLAASSDGAPLDVDALLAATSAQTRAGDARPSAARVSDPATPVIDTTQVPVDVQELAEKLKKHARSENRALVGRALRGEPLAAEGGRDDALQSLMSTVAFCLPDETPEPAILHMLGACFRNTDWAGNAGTIEEAALEKLKRARERKAKRDAERLEVSRKRWERLGLNMPNGSPAPLDEGDEPEDPDAWAGQLITIERRDKSGKVVAVDLKNCEANVELVLRCSREWKDVLRFNQVTKQLECVNPPAGIASSAAEGLDIEIAIWFQRSEYGRMGLSPRSDTVQNVLRQVVRASGYHPLVEYLDGLQWDGTTRVDGFLETYFGAAEDEPAYIRAVSRRWLVSFVCRGLTPGMKVDTVLILEGPQGLKKSTAVEVLAAPWFSDSKIDVTSKDALMMAGQYWAIELAELEAMTGRTKETMKAFFARRTDDYRVPYGKVLAPSPRQCIFVATTNSQQYLQVDPTGYRRYWPITCTKIDIAGLRRDRDQILAEAVALLKKGEQHWLTEDEAELAKVATKKRESGGSESFRQLVIDWFLKQAPEKRPAAVKLLDVMKQLGFDPQQITKSREMEVSEVLHALGFVNRFKRVNGVRAHFWETPTALLEAPQMLSSSALPPDTSRGTLPASDRSTDRG